MSKKKTGFKALWKEASICRIEDGRFIARCRVCGRRLREVLGWGNSQPGEIKCPKCKTINLVL